MKFSLSSKFVIGCSLTLLTALSATFYVINERQESLIIRQVENEARAIFHQIVIMRKWIADHGGVFVEKLPWTSPLPHISDPGIIDQQGRHYVRETPAMVTKELGRYAREEGLYWFHITSLQLTNPENAPDDFERRALLAFEEESLHEFISIETIDDQPYLRYISPLYVEDACLPCHIDQGYATGDIRGAISVTIPLSETFEEAVMNRRGMFASMLLAVAVLSGSMILMMRRLVLTPMKKLSTSIEGFSEGSYPKGPILQSGDEFEDLSRAFAEMAAKLTGYHEGLQDKIRLATVDLEATNLKLLEANRLLCITNERKSDFIARASHELRTPLTSIKGSMEYVTARISLESAGESRRDELLEFFELIRKNTDRLIRMVNTMLDIERIEMGAEGALLFSDIDLAEIIDESVTGFLYAAAHKDVQVTASVPGKLPLRADEDRIRQVLINLLANSVKFAPDHSQIAVRAFREGESVRVEVTDQGPGIAVEERERIFEKFYKTGNKEGSGLGLAICRSIIEAHGGTIGVAERPLPGTCMQFSLPVHGARIEAQSESRESVSNLVQTRETMRI
jgi:signal transduction histidine kinase